MLQYQEGDDVVDLGHLERFIRSAIIVTSIFGENKLL